jgi:hypothetical protein
MNEYYSKKEKKIRYRQNKQLVFTFQDNWLLRRTIVGWEIIPVSPEAKEQMEDAGLESIYGVFASYPKALNALQAMFPSLQLSPVRKAIVWEDESGDFLLKRDPQRKWRLYDIASGDPDYEDDFDFLHEQKFATRGELVTTARLIWPDGFS